MALDCKQILNDGGQQETKWKLEKKEYIAKIIFVKSNTSTKIRLQHMKQKYIAACSCRGSEECFGSCCKV